MKSARNYSIDLIRIISMLMILALHANLFLAKKVWSLNPKCIFFTVMEFICIIAVNLFILISGYFLEDSKFSIKKLVFLELLVVFYSVTVYIALVIFKYTVWDLKTFIKMFFPIVYSHYWFYTCYFVLYCITPFLKKFNKILQEKNIDKYFVIVLVILTSILPTLISKNSQLTLSAGYNYFWFITLVFIGAYIRTHKIAIKKWKCLLAYIIVLLLQLLLYYGIQYIKNVTLISNMHGFLYSYNNFLVLINSIIVFIFISNLDIKNKGVCKIIGFLSTSVFSVYLIHIHPLVMDSILSKKLDISRFFGTYKIYLYYFAFIIITFIICILIDKIRKVFVKLLSKIKIMHKVDERIKRLDLKIDSKVN